MPMKTEWVRFGAEGHVGYLALPDRAALPLPAILVIQEAWGVSDHLQDVTRRFAQAGYAALAPDLFARHGERPAPLQDARLQEVSTFLNAAPAAFGDAQAREAALAQRAQEERARIDETLEAIRASIGQLTSHVPAVVAAARWLREEHARTRGQRVGTVGFCMGGGVSGLLAAHDPELAAAVVFYGPPVPADLVGRIGCPMLGFYGASDARITSQLPAFRETMRAADKRFEAHVYEGAGHAFFNDGRPSYEVRAARDAFARTLSFFRAELAP